jgi:hypothetical protein
LKGKSKMAGNLIYGIARKITIGMLAVILKVYAENSVIDDGSRISWNMEMNAKKR